MKITCPVCGEEIPINGIGRKALGIAVINVCDALQAYSSVTRTAAELNCSRALVYKILKANGLKAKEVYASSDKTKRQRYFKDRPAMPAMQ